MRPFLLLILAITVTAISNSALAKDRWEGYRTMDSKEVKDLKLPFEDFAKNAVFEMETVGMTATPGEQFDVILDVNKEPEVTDPNLLSKDIRLMQIETCRKQGLTVCPVLGYSTRGTTFFNRGRFITCRHLFHNWISLASQLNGDRSVKEISPPMILRNIKGEVVYNSGWDSKPQMELDVINDDIRLNHQTSGKKYPSKEVAGPVYLSDYVEIKLADQQFVDQKSTLLSEYLPKNSDSLPTDETFLLGYSGKTNNFANGNGDAPGGKLVISKGYIENTKSSFYESTNYSSGGMSGGPIVSAKGELLGVFCKSTENSNPEKVRSYSFPIGKDFAQKYWRSLDYPTEQELASAQTAELTPVVSQ
ncbi:serine protease [bacterium]|nr:serine protease [bacterium]